MTDDTPDLVDYLAQHRTDNIELGELEAFYYAVQYEKLDSYTEDELKEMIESEIQTDQQYNTLD